MRFWLYRRTNQFILHILLSAVLICHLQWFTPACTIGLEESSKRKRNRRRRRMKNEHAWNGKKIYHIIDKYLIFSFCPLEARKQNWRVSKIMSRSFSVKRRLHIQYAQQQFDIYWGQTESLFFSFILLIHEGSHREVYQEFQPSYDIFCRWCQGLFRPQVPCTPSLHCPIANSASTQSQQQYKMANQI